MKEIVYIELIISRVTVTFQDTFVAKLIYVLSFPFLQNWFHNRRKKEALKLKRNSTVKKIQQSQLSLKDECAYRQSLVNSDNKSKTTRHLNFSKYVAASPVNKNIQIKTAKKFVAIKQKCKKNLTGFAVTQDKNGFIILHEL